MAGAHPRDPELPDAPDPGRPGPPRLNALAGEKSPYLLQHASNPVDWRPWRDAETLALARREDKPVFLSIGYATCHWCHVMERESFEDGETARILNAQFIPVKVDREERPDVDRVCMAAVQGLIGGGGWPLSVWLTPDGRPFYGGTYFPPEPRHGLPAFRDVLNALARAWTERRAEIETTAGELAGLVAGWVAPPPAAVPRVPPSPGDSEAAAARELRGQYDPVHGGFGGAPKFPRSEAVRFLLRLHARTGDAEALAMAETTLDRMARGGIFDPLGGGFARYATDAAWRIPHFEKMLYDNALLARAYLEAWQVTGREAHARTARAVLDYVLRDMTGPGGAFHSAEDADSEGVEGRFYVWTPAEVEAVLGRADGALACRFFGVTSEGNFEGGASVPCVPEPLEAFARREGAEPAEVESRLARARRALFEARARRVRPRRDDKVLTAWNALMISSLACGARVLDEPRYAAAAAAAARFLLANLRRGDGRLLARWRDGEARYPAYLDDHAFLAAALLDLYETDFDPAWFREAARLQAGMDRLFRDPAGGWFFTGSDAAGVLPRAKEGPDGALPSGNGVAALNALRLYACTGDDAHHRSAASAVASFGDLLARSPAAALTLVEAAGALGGPLRTVVIAGDPGAAGTRALLAAARRPLLPRTVVALVPASGADAETARLIPVLAGRAAPGGRATAYLCEGTVCRAPVSDPDALRRSLLGGPGPAG
jgi:uncharacterized protein YyaL (SSP411 family)